MRPQGALHGTVREDHAAPRRLPQRNAVDAQTGAALEGVYRGQIEDGGKRGQERHRPSALAADQNGRPVLRCTDHRQSAQGVGHITRMLRAVHLGGTTVLYRNLPLFCDEGG